MGVCVNCGNEYDKSFDVLLGGRTEADTTMCCWASCADQFGMAGLRDRI